MDFALDKIGLHWTRFRSGLNKGFCTGQDLSLEQPILILYISTHVHHDENEQFPDLNIR